MTRLSILIVFIGSAIVFTEAIAHPGHDHSIPSGNWPMHTLDE